jgi:hypothetical protein
MASRIIQVSLSRRPNASPPADRGSACVASFVFRMTNEQRRDNGDFLVVDEYRNPEIFNAVFQTKVLPKFDNAFTCRTFAFPEFRPNSQRGRQDTSVATIEENYHETVRKTVCS